MVRVIIRHLSGARATEIDVVTVGAHRELILGRASSAAIRFDARRDSAVGRQHARISCDDEGSTRFSLADLGSRNGTYVNGLRIADAVLLQRGDVVRLGASGPEVQLDWELQSPLVAQEQRPEL
jgi:pSer/pThr/pTyr-binding forkhead associated (FHA) protein